MPERAYEATFAFSAFMYWNASSSPMTCTSVASIRYAVPDVPGLPSMTSPLSRGSSRSFQHRGTGSFLLSCNSVL